MAPPTRVNLVEQTTALLQRYGAADERVRKSLRAEIAEHLIKIRETFTYRGRVDFAGKSTEYRTVYKELFERSGLPESDAELLKVAVRHHVQRLLRGRLAAAQRPEQADRTDAGALLVTVARLLRLVKPADLHDPTVQDAARDHLRNIQGRANDLLSYMDDSLTTEETDDVRARLAALEEENAKIRERLADIRPFRHEDTG